MQNSRLILGMLLVLTGCVEARDNFDPREKSATYDPRTQSLTLPYPCPDWSQSQNQNYRNELHSNFGCAVNCNNALQLADPADLYRGHGAASPDAEVTTRTIERYLAGEIPEPLTPIQDTSGP